MIGIYIASKMTHAEKWRKLFDERTDVHWTARWPYLEPFVVPSAANARRFWVDDIHDVSRSDAVIVYAEPEEKLRGALVEAGAALALGKIVLLVGGNEDFSTWQFHPLVRKVLNIPAAIAIARTNCL